MAKWAIRRQEPPPCEGREVGRRCHMKPWLELGSCSALSGHRERIDRKEISVRISERELLGLRVRIHMWLLFELSDESACPLQRQVEIIHTEEQQKSQVPVYRRSVATSTPKITISHARPGQSQTCLAGDVSPRDEL